jgi:hypothetical protein
MHIGNVYAMLAAWLSARACPDGRIALRIEDIDVPRVVPDADRWIMDDLAWLGLDWDGEPVYQSQRGEIYESALRALESRAMPGAREVGTGAGLELAACARDNGGGPVREADGDPEPGARGAFPVADLPVLLFACGNPGGIGAAGGRRLHGVSREVPQAAAGAP